MTRWEGDEVRGWGAEEVRMWGCKEMLQWGGEAVRMWIPLQTIYNTLSDHYQIVCNIFPIHFQYILKLFSCTFRTSLNKIPASPRAGAQESHTLSSATMLLLYVCEKYIRFASSRTQMYNCNVNSRYSHAILCFLKSGMNNALCLLYLQFN